MIEELRDGKISKEGEVGTHGVATLVTLQLGEPVVFGGPFVMNTHEQISSVRARFTRGEVGRLKPSVDFAAQVVAKADARSGLVREGQGVRR